MAMITMRFPGGVVEDVPDDQIVQAMARGGMQIDAQRYALDQAINDPPIVITGESETKED